MPDTQTTSPREAVDRVLDWLELDQPLGEAARQSLSERFLIAACSPASTYIIVASKKNVVQIFGGKVSCAPVPEGANLTEEIEARFGGRFLDVSNVFAACMIGIEGRRRERFLAQAEASYEATAPDRRMVLGA